MITWVLVADRSSARVFAKVGHSMNLVRAFKHPDGRKKNSELETGHLRESYDAAAPDRNTASMPHEQTAIRFAKDLAAELRSGRLERSVTEVVLVAEPHFLGLVRQELDAPTRALVVTTIAKDLVQANLETVRRQIESAV